MAFLCSTYRREDKTWVMRVPPVAYEEVYEFHLPRWEKKVNELSFLSPNLKRRRVHTGGWKAIFKDIGALQKSI